MLSLATKLGPVPFPEHTGERVYMRRFLPSEGLPADLKRWQSTVSAMLEGVEATGPCFLMVDQGEVEKGHLHRRAGLHVDLNWIETAGWSDGWRPPASQWDGGWKRGGSQGIFLATDVLGARALVGDFDQALIGQGGDSEAVRRAGLVPVELEAGFTWKGDACALLHESIPVAKSGPRTVVRLHVEGLQ